jgi:NAD(P)-dependent dehydrogenase (short-subunit alcohol dehydrogenase family)
VFEVNVFGPVAVTQAMLPLIRRGPGRIVNMGSIAGRAAVPFIGPYAASKFALEALTDVMRLELRPWGIHVAIVEPGAVVSRLWEKARHQADELEAFASPQIRAYYGAAVARVREAMERASRRAIPAQVVARAVAHALFAARPKTRYVVGLDARLRAILASWLPDRVQDWLLVRWLRLPRSMS